MMQCGKDTAATFKTMAEDLNVIKLTSNSEDTEHMSSFNSGDDETEKDRNTAEETSMTRKVLKSQFVSDDSNSYRLCAEITGQLAPQAVNTRLKAKDDTEMKDASSEHRLNTNQNSANSAEDKENIAMSSSSSTAGK